MSFIDIAVGAGAAIAEGAAAVGEAGAAAATAVGEGAGALGEGIAGLGSTIGEGITGLGSTIGEGLGITGETAAETAPEVEQGITALPETGTPTTPMEEEEEEEVGEKALSEPKTQAQQLPQTPTTQPNPTYNPAQYDANSVGAQMGKASTNANVTGDVGSQTSNVANAAKDTSFLKEYQTPLMLGALGMMGLGAMQNPNQATPASVQSDLNWSPYPKNDYKWNDAAYSNYNTVGHYAPGFGTNTVGQYAPGFGTNTATPVVNTAAYNQQYAGGGITQLGAGSPAVSGNAKDSVDFMGGDMYPTSQQKLSFYSAPTQEPTSAAQAMASYEPNTNPLTGEPSTMMAKGGIATLGGYSDGGRLLKGPGDGVSDSIPASINGKEPARLADGEFVIPARIVSELGNGSTDAGAKQLYAMMDRVQKRRSKTTGKKHVAKNTHAYKDLPA